MKPGLTVTVDLARVAQNAAEVKARTGRFVYAVVKADGYGLGAAAVAPVLADVCDGFYVFDLAEAAAIHLSRLGKPIIALDQPWLGYRLEDYQTARVRPVVFSVERAGELRQARPVLAVDTGMHRFGCPQELVNQAISAGGVDEAMTHAARLDAALAFQALLCGRGLLLHAAGTGLLNEPAALLDAVRPGLALYRGALRASARVVEARDVRGGRAGYGQFEAQRVGIILAGYSHGLRAGPCQISGQRRRIFEVGMQSAYVELLPAEGVGTEVVILGEELAEEDVASAWGMTPQQVLVRLGGCRRAAD